MSALLAVPAQFTTITLGATGTAVTAITAITKANPAVATKTAHGLTGTQVVVITAATGMIEINGRVAIARPLTVDTIELGGIDSTLFTAYSGSAGIITPTAAKVSGMESYTSSGAAATQISATDMDSTQQENLTGLSGAGTMSLTLQKSWTDIGQKALEASAGTPGANFLLSLTTKAANGTSNTVTTTGACSKTDFSGGTDALTKGSAELVLAAKWK